MNARVLPLLMLPLLAAFSNANESAIEVFSKTASFEEVRDNLALEVTRRGMVLTQTIAVNDMLEKTAKEVGAVRPVYVNAEALAFCSPSLGRKLMEANSSNIVCLSKRLCCSKYRSARHRRAAHLQGPLRE